MEQNSTPLLRRGIYQCLVWATFFLVLCLVNRANAQQSSLPCNATVSTPFDNGTFTVTQSNSSPGVASWTSPGNVVDGNAGTSATGNIVLGGSVTISVKDPTHIYNAGNFAGFLVQPSTVVAAASLTIRTRLAGAEQDTRTVPIFLLSTSTPYEIGLITTKTFDEIELTYGLIGITGSIDVFNAVQRGYCTAGPALACNTPTTPTGTTYPMIIDPANTGFSGINVASITNQDNAISPSTTDFASLNLLVSAGSVSFAIKDQITDYPIGSFAGIDISNPGLVSINALSGLTISTYLNGTATGQSVSGADLVTVGSSLLSGSGRKTVGFIATSAFDEIKLTVTGATVAGVTNIYGAVFETFCNGPSLACSDNAIPQNTLTPLIAPTSPVYVDGTNTGFPGGVCVGCSINNEANVIDNNTSNSATIILTAGVTSANFAVANALDTYPAKSFAGFDISSQTILKAAVISSATITLYNNGTLVQTSTGNALLVGATTDLLTDGTSRQIVGVVANQPYDEVKITFSQLVNANLGTINIYNAVFEKTCSAVIACNTAYNLSNPTFPVVIDAARTGVTGLVAVETTIKDPWNVVSASTTDYAVISNTAAVGTNASIAVLNALDSYPAGTFAGFSVQKVSGLASVDLFSRLTVNTYKNGTLVESRTGGGLLDLSIILFGSTSEYFNVGFVTSQSFDEIQLSVAPLVGLSVLSGNLRVYGAFIDTRTSSGGGLVCALVTNPDFNVTNKNIPVTGSVKTNDIVPVGTTYGPAPASTTQPAGSTPTLTVASDGSYTFVSATPGVYVYSVPVCGSGLSGTGCATQTLTITVLDPTVNTNNPVANPDVASMLGSDTSPSPITVNVRINDGPGNPGGTLGLPTIATNPSNGSASVNGSGNVVYTPAAGFYGTDKFTYTVCETPGTSLCASTTVTITVSATGSPNTTLAADDYVSTYQGTPVSGNVKTNDSDPEGNAQTITAQNTTITGVGTLVLAADGTYTFTPVAGATGPVDFSYTTTDNGSPNVSANGTLHILIIPLNLLKTNPDFNVTNKNVPATGSVKTNDIVPVGTTYGPAPASTTQPAGSTPTLTVASDGSYTFVSATPGVYVYSVPVCGSGLSGTGCATQTLTITVLDPTVNTNNPVANPDVVSMVGAPTTPSSVTVNVKANDGPGNPGGTLGIPTIATGPANGSATVDGSGNVVYTPAAGFYGTDKFTYTVCETPGTSLCASSTVTVTVNAPGTPNTTLAADDYISTYQGAVVTGNVKTNDSDPEGNTQTITTQNTTVPGIGTLVLAADGTYTFTPVAGATGPVDFSYTTTDNGSPSASANGTLHILINPFNPNPDFNVTDINVPVPGSVKTNDVVPVGTTYGPTATLTSSPGSATLTLTPTGSYTFTASTPGVYTYSVPVCVTGTPPVCTTQTLTITVLNPAVNTNNPVANPDFATTTGAPGSPTAVTVNIKVNDGPGNPGGTLGTPTIPVQPVHGNATIDGSGNLVYTPTAGYYGTDIVNYVVCETPSTPSCATATVTITVKAPNSPAIVSANDDYVASYGGIPATGNVLNNDLGTGLSVSNAGTTVTSSGTLVLTSLGSYTFTPTLGATGPVDFTYTACDSNTPSTCASATLHVLINQGVPDLTPTTDLPQANFPAASSRDFVVNIEELAGQSTSSGNVAITISAPAGYTISYSGSITSINITNGTSNVAVDNTKWTVTNSGNSQQISLTINAGQFIAAKTIAKLGFTITRTTANTGSASNITVNVNDDPSHTYDGNPLNNVYSRIISGI